jgi:outer membrane protein assembly factor BamA
VRYIVEAIRVSGNHTTRQKVIRAKLPIEVGDTITPTDPRVETARLELLSMGLFRGVSFALSKGSRPGRVVLTVRVRERGTIVLQALDLGYSNATPFWGGVDVAETNFLGLGLRLSGAFVVGAASENIGGSRLQHAERLRFSYPRLFADRVGISAVLLHNEAADYFRLRGRNPDGSDVENFAAVNYRRAGGLLGVFSPLGRLNHVYVDYRLEWINARLPVAAVRDYPDGREERLRFDLRRNESWLSSLTITFARDTRNDPAMPTKGMRLELSAELATTYIGSDYQFAKLRVDFQKYWLLPWKRHVISLHLFAGVILGETPLFNKYFIGDLSELVPSRSLGLNFSTRPTRNLFSNSILDKRYETVAGRAAVAYRIPLSRGGRLVYGSDFYVSLGLISLLSNRDFRIRDQGLRTAIPIDLTFDLGFRLDTYVGVFKLSFGNALGWIPR